MITEQQEGNFPTRDRRAVLVGGVVLAAAALAWVVVVLQALGMATTMPDAAMSGEMEAMSSGGTASLLGALTFLTAWGVMMAAMMLPSATPMIILYGATRRRFAATGQQLLPTAFFATTYLAVWLLFGLPVYLVGLAVDAAAMASPTVMALLPYALAGVLLAAGLYQFSALKRICLRGCQNPLSFLMARWRGGYLGTLRMGLAHALYCVGCCWGLMTVLVAAGAMGLRWVVLIALVVLAEKLGPRGEWTTRIVGGALLLLAAIVALQPGLASILRG